MVRVSWNGDTGEIIGVKSGSGPRRCSEDISPKQVEQALSDTSSVDEFEVAATIAAVYDGELDLETAVVTTETYPHPELDGARTTLGFVEKSNLIDKLSAIVCENCSFDPELGSDWSSRYRDGSQFEYTDWYCPDCGTVVHTEIYHGD